MVNMKMMSWGALVAASLLLAACGKDDDSGKVVATVNGQSIKDGAITQQMAQMPPQMVQGNEATIRRQLLDQLVQQNIIDQEATKANVEADVVYQQQLKQAERQIKAGVLLQRKVDSVLTPDALRQAYESTKAQRAFPAVKARHILVATEAEAKALILAATPQNFAQLAREKSVGPSKDNGGELGWFRREAMTPEFAKVAFNTPAGTVAQAPVQTQFGWHVVLVEERNEKFIPPFEQVAQGIKQELSGQVAQAYLAELRKNAQIAYTDPSDAPQAAPQVAPAAGQ